MTNETNGKTVKLSKLIKEFGLSNYITPKRLAKILIANDIIRYESCNNSNYVLKHDTVLWATNPIFCIGDHTPRFYLERGAELFDRVIPGWRDVCQPKF